MAQYTITSHYASVFALDTHARTTTVKGINLQSGETKTRRFSDCPTTEQIVSWMQKNFPAPYYAAYESGCTGFYLCRKLRASGVFCDVIAVSTIARSTDDRQRKTDRRDATGLLRELLNPVCTSSVVWMPDEKLEGIRDFLRCYRDASIALKRAKQQTLALLLRHGYVFNEKTPSGKRKTYWSEAFAGWLDSVDLNSEDANDTLASYRGAITENSVRCKRMLKHIEDIAQKPRFKPYVDALCLISGVDVYSAVVYASEIGDFSRFKNGRSISKWVGVTPKSHNSGEKQNNNGHITKAGSIHVRACLIEGCSAIGRRKYAPAKLKVGREVSEYIIAECNKCNRRLIDKHHHLICDLHKTANVAKVAIANEMIRWVWHIGYMVQAEQENKKTFPKEVYR
jgi:transposase